MTVLPLIDISRLASQRIEDRLAVASELDSACADAGFVYIAGEQVKAAPFAKLLARAQSYFTLDLDTKMRGYIGYSENHSGYVPIGEEEFADGKADLKEAYDVGCEYLPAEGRRPLLGPNMWPVIHGFREDVEAYYRHVTGIGRQLFRAFALALGLAEDHFDPFLRHPPSQLRLIHYPFDPGAQDRPGIGAHTDYECFTLLYATAPGLQIVNQRGEWVDVPLIDGTLIMNIGDMMEILSNGRYVATRHRVKKVAQERYAFALFHALDYDTVVAPIPRGETPLYAPLSGGEHLFTRTAQTFAYLKRRVSNGELMLAESAPVEAFGRIEAQSGHRPGL